MDRKTLLIPILTGLGYYLAGVFAVNHTIMPEGIAIMWPPNAFLLSGLLLSDRKLWPFVILAAALAEFAADWSSFPVWQISGFAAVNVFECTLSAILIQKLTKSQNLSLNIRNLAIVAVVIILVSPPLAALRYI